MNKAYSNRTPTGREFLCALPRIWQTTSAFWQLYWTSSSTSLLSCRSFGKITCVRQLGVTVAVNIIAMQFFQTTPRDSTYGYISFGSKTVLRATRQALTFANNVICLYRGAVFRPKFANFVPRITRIVCSRSVEHIFFAFAVPSLYLLLSQRSNERFHDFYITPVGSNKVAAGNLMNAV